jgi:hypothetical protein
MTSLALITMPGFPDSASSWGTLFERNPGSTCLVSARKRQVEEQDRESHPLIDQLTWRKSSYSGQNGGDCIECAPAAAEVRVRDSKDALGPQLAFDTEAWADFVNAVATMSFTTVPR